MNSPRKTLTALTALAIAASLSLGGAAEDASARAKVPVPKPTAPLATAYDSETGLDAPACEYWEYWINLYIEEYRSHKAAGRWKEAAAALQRAMTQIEHAQGDGCTVDRPPL